MLLDIRNVSHTYDNGVHALRDLSLRIEPGLFGLLGPNGAGKSSLMRTLATLQRPDAGTIRLGDIDLLAEPSRARPIVGYLPQDFGLYPRLSAEDTLDHFLVLKGVRDRATRGALIGELLERVNLHEVRRQHVGGFSGGMRQRLGVAIALAGAPKLVIVDEPTAGLDPAERFRFLNLLAALAEDVVVILSTHIVQDVEALCRRVAILQAGTIVAEGTPDELTKALRGQLWRARVGRDAARAVSARHHVLSQRLVAGELDLLVRADAAPIGATFRPAEPDLEAVFFHHAPAQHAQR